MREVKPAAMHTIACHHLHPSIGPVYEYCEDCGAVRVRPDLKPDDGRWRTCAECFWKEIK